MKKELRKVVQSQEPGETELGGRRRPFRGLLRLRLAVHDPRGEGDRRGGVLGPYVQLDLMNKISKPTSSFST